MGAEANLDSFSPPAHLQLTRLGRLSEGRFFDLRLSRGPSVTRDYSG
jgi:hypothetical protein